MDDFAHQTELTQAMLQATESARQLEVVLNRLTKALKKHDIGIKIDLVSGSAIVDHCFAAFRDGTGSVRRNLLKFSIVVSETYLASRSIS